MFKIVRELKTYWSNYLLQSFLATVAIFIILFILSLENAVVAASLASTALITFIMPGSITSRPQNVIGGQLIGLCFGSICAFIPHTYWLASVLVYTLAVGLSIFAMVSTRMMHPPAAGTAFGIAITGVSWLVAITLIISVLVLSLVRKLLENHLKDFRRGKSEGNSPRSNFQGHS